MYLRRSTPIASAAISLSLIEKKALPIFVLAIFFTPNPDKINTNSVNIAIKLFSFKTKLPNVTPSSKLKPKSIKSGDFLPRPDPVSYTHLRAHET